MKYFGTDGIRGVANDGLSLDIAFRLGQYLGHLALKNNSKKVVIGKDTRRSSSMFEHIIASALASVGVDVTLIGYCSTPCLAYVCEKLDFIYGVMISASHNPYYDNGIKIFTNTGIKLDSSLEEEIEQFIDNYHSDFNVTHDKLGEIVSNKELVLEYENWLVKLYPNDLSNFKILVDLANGSNYQIAKNVLSKLNCQADFINDTPSGININYECGSTHLENLSKAIKNNGYDLGLAFDGDADRLQCVDLNGNVVSGDLIMYVLAKYLKQTNKLNNDYLVVTGYSNTGLLKALANENIQTSIVDNGDKYVLEEMIKKDYSLGGEDSGHIIIKHDSLYGDGLKSALALLNALSFLKQSLTEAIGPVSIYPSVLKNVKVKDKQAFKNDVLVSTAIDTIKNELGANGKILVRPSGTEPLVRLLIEASSKEICEKYITQLENVIASQGHKQD